MIGKTISLLDVVVGSFDTPTERPEGRSSYMQLDDASTYPVMMWLTIRSTLPRTRATSIWLHAVFRR